MATKKKAGETPPTAGNAPLSTFGSLDKIAVVAAAKAAGNMAKAFKDQLDARYRTTAEDIEARAKAANVKADRDATIASAPAACPARSRFEPPRLGEEH